MVITTQTDGRLETGETERDSESEHVTFTASSADTFMLFKVYLNGYMAEKAYYQGIQSKADLVALNQPVDAASFMVVATSTITEVVPALVIWRLTIDSLVVFSRVEAKRTECFCVSI